MKSKTVISEIRRDVQFIPRQGEIIEHVAGRVRVCTSEAGFDFDDYTYRSELKTVTGEIALRPNERELLEQFFKLVDERLNA